jgi:lipopolysaccharide export system protein LptC
LDSHSRFVAWLKVLLPLAALGLLSSVFLLSRSTDPTATIPFSDLEVGERLRSQQITRPFFSGTTAEGDDIIVSAEKVRPGGPGIPAEADRIAARIIMADGVRLNLVANTAAVDFEADQARFAGDVRLTSTSGFSIVTERLNTGLNRITGDAPERIDGTGPIGNFTAGAMSFAEKNRGGPIHMLFTNGVKLIYDPKISRKNTP